MAATANPKVRGGTGLRAGLRARPSRHPGLEALATLQPSSCCAVFFETIRGEAASTPPASSSSSVRAPSTARVGC